MTIRQAVKENKMISIVLTVLASALLAWGVWVTDACYQIKYGRNLIDSRREIADLKQEAELKVACQDIFELKKTDAFLISEIKDIRETSHKNFQEILKLLLDIQRTQRQAKQ